MASAKVEVLSRIPQKSKGESEQNVRAKLPKLVISKFNGDLQGWQRFWGQFTETIDKTTMPPITSSRIYASCLTPRLSMLLINYDSRPRAMIGQNPSSKIVSGRNRKLSSRMSKIYWACHISQAQTQEKSEISVSG